jgi:pimeloyl-ACP methyl ester carboxylesterase
MDLLSAFAGQSPVYAQEQPMTDQPSTGPVVAASVSYQVVDRPAQVPASFTAPNGVDLSFLAYTAIDGETNLAALVQPLTRTPGETTLVLYVHGSGGNFYGSVAGSEVMPLAQQGYAGLSINTRGHDQQINTDNFFDTRNDLAAAVSIARALGYGRIVLQGHSLGTSQVLYYAATDWSREIKGVILSAPFADLPWKTQHILVADDELYRQLYQEAMQAVRASQPDAVLQTSMPYLLGQTSRVTARHFLTYRWAQESTVRSVEWIRRVTVPVLIVRDQADQIIMPFETAELYSAATNDGSLVPNVQNVLIPNASNANGHSFPHTTAQLIEVTLNWLRQRGLEPEPPQVIEG